MLRIPRPSVTGGSDRHYLVSSDDFVKGFDSRRGSGFSAERGVICSSLKVRPGNAM